MGKQQIGGDVMKELSRNKMKILLVGVLIGAYLFVAPVRLWLNEVIGLFAQLEVDSIKVYILSFGVWAPIISFGLMIFQSVAAPLPAFLITFANAALFGWIKGALLSWSGAMAGATVCFVIARFMGRDAVIKLTSRFALEKVDAFFDEYGKYAILIARLLPFMSFDVVSYGAGLTSIGFWSFFWATGLGQLPATLVYSYVGEMLVGDVKIVVFGLMLLFSLTVLIALIKKMRG